MMKDMLRDRLTSLITKLSFYLIVGTTLLLPLFFLPITTDAFELPKQLLLLAVTLVLLIFSGLKAVFEKKCSIRRTPFDIAILLFTIALICSIFFSESRSVALINGLPHLAVVVFMLLVIYTIKTREQEKVLILAAIISSVLLAVFTLLTFLKIYILPYPAARVAGFSPAGSVFSASVFFITLFPVAIALVLSQFQAVQKKMWAVLLLLGSSLIGIGLIIGIYQLVTVIKPPLLSQEIGLRTALQPLGSNFQTALFGTGPGTYLFDFTRFRDPALNATNLWNVRFSNSSSFFLEVLSTIGLIGGLSFLLLIAQTFVLFFRSGGHHELTVGVFLAFVISALFSLMLPFSYISVFVLFLLLALFVVRLSDEQNPLIHDVTISMVTLQRGSTNDLLPYVVLLVYLLVSGLIIFGIPGQRLSLTRFIDSDITFQKALVAAGQNKAKESYDLQKAAIDSFPKRDSYHRIFSQTNLTIANSIAQQTRNASAAANQATGTISDADKQTIVALVRQSIAFGRNATILSPLNVINWENLGNVYRNLIGFAQNADSFAIEATQQAVRLDPTNVMLRIRFGGIYLQLGQYDNAITQFQIAVGFKPDLANAHYNLGHAHQAKGGVENLKAALMSYRQVRNLVKPDSDDFKKIDEEIQSLENKIPQTGESTTESPTGDNQQEPLQISSPSAIFPTQKPPVTVEGPPVTEIEKDN